MLQTFYCRYNAALGMQDLLEYCHQCFCFDNSALSGIVQQTLEIDIPKMHHLNNIVALCMSGKIVQQTLEIDIAKMHDLNNIVVLCMSGNRHSQNASPQQYRRPLGVIHAW